MIAVIVVRDGVLPAGAVEAVAECAGRAVLIGSATTTAAEQLTGYATELVLAETDATRPGACAGALAPRLAGEPIVVLPASPDGRDLAPRLAALLRRPLLANAARIEPHLVITVRGTHMQRLSPEPAFVATLIPGVRGALANVTTPPTVIDERIPATDDADDVDLELPGGSPDATCVAVLPPDAATIDLAEANRILGGGAGLDSAERFAQLAAIGASIDASVGATRVITDRHWIGHERQIGTTSVVVRPQLYVAFGVSGAVQHTSGLGHPDHVISVNTDPHCPMMQMADLAIVADANAVVGELVARVSQ